LALPANIRLGWKGLPETNTLAYYNNPLITDVKSFIVQAHAPQWERLEVTDRLASHTVVITFVKGFITQAPLKVG
jgi:hypothetical protein